MGDLKLSLNMVLTHAVVFKKTHLLDYVLQATDQGCTRRLSVSNKICLTFFIFLVSAHLSQGGII